MPTIIKAHKIRLNPTPEQEKYFWQAANVARFTFNWGLAEYNRRKDAGEAVVKIAEKGPCIIKDFVLAKSEQFQWVNEVSSYAYQGAFRDLQKAISGYFTKKKNGTLKKPANFKPRKDGKPFGWPRFKAKNKTVPAFYQANTCLKFNDNEVKIQKCPGWVNMTQPLRFDGKVMGARVSYHANYWWLSVQVEIEHETPVHNNNAVGLDLGIKYLGVASDGQIFDNPKPLEKVQRKLARLQRKLDRQMRANNPDNYNPDGTVKKGATHWVKSKSMQETEKEISKLYFRAANIRKEASHKMTSSLTDQYGVVGIEDLNIGGMLKNRKLSKAVSDAALYEKRRQLEYKATWKGGTVVTVSRWFPSSKMCHGCGEINANLKLSDREWTCPNCGKFNHRDGNASENIRDEAIGILTGRTTQTDSLNDSALTLAKVKVVE